MRLKDAQKALEALRRSGVLANARPARLAEELHIPVLSFEMASEVLERLSIASNPCSGSFEVYVRKPTKLSEVVPGLTGFVKLGSIVVFNYTKNLGLHTYLQAAEALRSMYSDLTSVFVKLGTTGELRLPELLLIYGDGNTVTKVRENGLEFLVDVKRTYFNVRLSGERARVANMVRDGELVLDMFSGVGPFAITIASRSKAFVFSVDLNPYASYLAAMNVRLNRKRLKGQVSIIRADSIRLPDFVKMRFDRIIMNNPTASLIFADAACRLSGSGSTIHVYTLGSSEGEAVSKVVNSFGASCNVEVVYHRKVLEYSPSKSIYVVDVIRRG